MPVRVSVHVDRDVRSALRALRGMPRDASRELRQASREIVRRMIPLMRLMATTRQARAAARSLRPASDRVPAIAVGGRRRVTSSPNGFAGSIFFGSEHGAVEWKQFPRPEPTYWFWDTLGWQSKEIMRTWGRAYDRVVDRWGAP